MKEWKKQKERETPRNNNWSKIKMRDKMDKGRHIAMDKYFVKKKPSIQCELILVNTTS